MKISSTCAPSACGAANSGREAPPFDIGPDTLFVAYSAWAEMTCFKVLGWQFPMHIFDQHTAYLAASNILLPYDPDEKRERSRASACPMPAAPTASRVGSASTRRTIAKAIGEGRWREYGQRGRVSTIAKRTCASTAQLLRAQLRGSRGRALPAADVERVLHWSNYSAKAIALIQARGIPIDMPLWNLVQENKARRDRRAAAPIRSEPWRATIRSTRPRANGATRASRRWLMRAGVTAWPRLDSGALDTQQRRLSPDVLTCPASRGCTRCATASASSPRRGCRSAATVAIGRRLFPFGTATGRNAHAKSPYNAHAGMRSFMVFPPDTIGVYLDWRTQEVGIAAALSGDAALMRAYRGGDVYHALARMCGLTDDPDPMRWKRRPTPTCGSA